MKRVLLLILPLLMLVLVSAQDCTIHSKNTAALLDEIPDLNARLQECDTTIPSPASMLFGDDIINVQVVRNDGSKSNFMITTEDNQLKSIETGYSEDPTFVATIAECALDNALASDNLGGALAYLYDNNHLTIAARGFWNRIVFGLSMMFAGGAIGDLAEEIDTSCTKKKVGEICQHGGECETGNCIGIVPGQVYKCSCDPFKYVAADTDGNCPPAPEYPEEGQGKVGDLCQHGGQCETGNCIGIVPGQVYKCSCDPFKYVAADTDGNCPPTYN
jgi:hypothetical protein